MRSKSSVDVSPVAWRSTASPKLKSGCNLLTTAPNPRLPELTYECTHNYHHHNYRSPPHITPAGLADDGVNLMDSSFFDPDLGSVSEEVQLIQRSCLQSTLTHPRRDDHAPTPLQTANLSFLPTELLDHILSYLTASSAVAFKLTSRSLHRTEPSFSDILVNPCFDRQEAFRAKCYLESLSSPSNLQDMFCSGCLRKHHSRFFTSAEKLSPAHQRKCFATCGFTFFGQPLSIPPGGDRSRERPSSPAGRASVPSDGMRLLLLPVEPSPMPPPPAATTKASKRRVFARGRMRAPSQAPHMPKYSLQLRTGDDGKAKVEVRVEPEQQQQQQHLQRHESGGSGKRTRSRSSKRIKPDENGLP